MILEKTTPPISRDCHASEDFSYKLILSNELSDGKNKEIRHLNDLACALQKTVALRLRATCRFVNTKKFQS